MVVVVSWSWALQRGVRDISVFGSYGNYVVLLFFIWPVHLSNVTRGSDILDSAGSQGTRQARIGKDYQSTCQSQQLEKRSFTSRPTLLQAREHCQRRIKNLEKGDQSALQPDCPVQSTCDRMKRSCFDICQKVLFGLIYHSRFELLSKPFKNKELIWRVIQYYRAWKCYRGNIDIAYLWLLRKIYKAFWFKSKGFI